MKKELLLFLMFPLFLLPAFSQSIELYERHSFALNTGVMMNSQTSSIAGIEGVSTETNVIGFIEYKYWFNNEWAVNVQAGYFGAETNTNFNGVESIMITPVLIGFSYYPDKLTLGNVGRVYMGMNTGIYIANASKSTGGFIRTSTSTGSFSESVFGAEPYIGVDFFISRYFRIGPQLSYHFITDFSEAYGTRKNYSGASFSVMVGVMF